MLSLVNKVYSPVFTFSAAIVKDLLNPSENCGCESSPCRYARAGLSSNRLGLPKTDFTIPSGYSVQISLLCSPLNVSDSHSVA